MNNELPYRKPLRIINYNYSDPGFYFVTLCVKKRPNIFGKIVDSNMLLNQFGEIVNTCWTELPVHYTNCKLDSYVIMPDHFHGIIFIEYNQNNTLASIIKGFKSFSSKQINLLLDDGQKFQWQKSFYDRVIRDEDELFQVRKYIEQNPLKWDIL